MKFREFIKQTWKTLRAERPLRPRRQVTFITVRGRAVPCRPWPQAFYVSRTMLHSDTVELRPLTLLGLGGGLGRNWITIGYHTIMNTLWWLGFLEAQEGECLHWRGLNFRPWRTRRERAWGWVICDWCGGEGYDPEAREAAFRINMASRAPAHAPEAGMPMWYDCSKCGGLGIVPPRSRYGAKGGFSQ